VEENSQRRYSLMTVQTLGHPKSVTEKRPRVIDIDIDINGASDADFQVVANRYAANQFRRDVKDSAWKHFLALLGLYNAPNERAHRSNTRK
jgi:hypothetical protein